MQQLVPYLLWLGHAGDGRDAVAILQAEIQAVVQLAVEEPPLLPPRDLIVYRFPLLDGTGNDERILRTAISSVAALVHHKIPTLLCCSAGMSRSPVIAAAALAATSGGDIRVRLKEISRDRPVDVSPGLLESIISLGL